MTPSIISAAVISLGMTGVTALVNRRASHQRDEERLDGDSLGSRFAWSSDVISLAGVALPAITLVIFQYSVHGKTTARMGVIALCGLTAGGAAGYVFGKQTPEFINRYPDSLYQLISRTRYGGPRRLMWLTPGVVLSISLGVVIAAAAVTS